MAKINLSFENTKLWDYLRWNSYLSEKNKLLYVATPKVACTSLKWWFASMEGYFKILSEFQDSAESDPELVIHDSFHKVAPGVTGLMPEQLKEPIVSDLYFRFAVVRNPYKRLFSAWQSKLLLREPLQIEPYLKYDFIWMPIESAADIAYAFESFVEHLASREVPDFWDIHWTPQVTLLRPDLIAYTKLVQIEKAKELSLALAERLGSDVPDPFENHRTNESLIPYQPDFITERAAALIRSLYAEDFKTFGYDNKLPEAKGEFSIVQLNVALQAIRLIRGRHQRLAQIRTELSRQIADLKQTVVERDGQIDGLKQTVVERDGQIDGLKQTMVERDGQIDGLKQAMVERDGQIASLKQTVIESDRLISVISSSRSWKITKPLRFLGRVMRGEWRAVLESLRAHSLHWGHRNKRIGNSSKRRIVRLLLYAYSSSAVIRRCFTTIKKMSNKLVRPWFPSLHNRVFVDFKLYLQRWWLTGSGETPNAALPEFYTVPKLTQEKFYPKVSIIVPNYNHAKYLRQRLESIYRQTYRNFEVILLDDASNDNSTEILEEFRLSYPSNTKCYFNKINSGGVFYQWNRGFELAKGELIWIAESDDFCSDNLLTELVEYFTNEAVMLAYCRTVFVKDDTSEQIWNLEDYLRELDPTLWEQPFVKSAHQLVNTSWAIKNIVPNVSSAIFRNPGKLELLENEEWKRMRICGDWVFYLHIIRGGLVAYTPIATNYYRIHNNNTSISTYKQDIYYQEYEKVAEELIKLYRLQEGVLEKQQRILERDWLLHRKDNNKNSFRKCYNLERIRHLFKIRKENLLMVTYALAAGGGETFPIRLANLLKAAGYCVTLMNCNREPTEFGVRKMLRGDIPLLELDHIQKLNAVVDDMGIEILHSHHAWVDMTICTLLENNPNCKVVVSMHGMYEMIPRADMTGIIPLLNKRVNKFVYAADKNLEPFKFCNIDKSRFTKIGNALEILPVFPVPREELGINENDFVLCMVSRAIPDKGWQEGIEAVKLAREQCGKEIHLLVIGEGPEYERLRGKVGEYFIHFLGFRANIRDYFATSDLGFLPTRFRGESFPLVIIDCLQSNRPMLASDIGEIAMMLKTDSGLAGSVFSINDWNIPIHQVAEIISEYAKNRDLYSEHLRRVPAAASKFDIKTLIHSYDQVYQEVIGDKMCSKS